MAFLLAGASVALADPPEGHNPNGKMLGVITPKGHGTKASGGPTLLYHRGPVMDTNTTYTIFWAPTGYSFADGYIELVNRFFTDVGIAHGSSSNVYAVATQYTGPTGEHISYGSSYGGTWNDTTTPYPNHCNATGTTACLTDADLQAEVQKAIQAHNGAWPTGTGAAYFVFTPKDVGSCAGSCFPAHWCAYHSWIGSGSSAILYANMPFQDQTPNCDGGQHPNVGVDPNADATIDAASHEHNEMITDPEGSGWFTHNGYEEADLCNFVYGPLLGDQTNNLGYNQTINSNNYFAQEEWSNADAAKAPAGTPNPGCVQGYSSS